MLVIRQARPQGEVPGRTERHNDIDEALPSLTTCIICYKHIKIL